MLSTQHRPNPSAPSDGSRTIVVTDVKPKPDEEEGPSVPEGTLRLRGGPRSHPRVAWDEGVIDNEDCGRKKSKICCIYHKPKEFDESSDESSSDEESDSLEDGRARHRHAHHSHAHLNGVTGSGAGNGLRRGDEIGVVHELEDPPKTNAYESLPKKGKSQEDN